MVVLATGSVGATVGGTVTTVEVGVVHDVAPSLPPAATTTILARSAASTASWMVVSGPVVPRLMLMTLAPWSMA